MRKTVAFLLFQLICAYSFSQDAGQDSLSPDEVELRHYLADTNLVGLPIDKPRSMCALTLHRKYGIKSSDEWDAMTDGKVPGKKRKELNKVMEYLNGRNGFAWRKKLQEELDRCDPAKQF